jgi:hypothetical protein
MVYNERKRQAFEFFAARQWVAVSVYAVAVCMYPILVSPPKEVAQVSYPRRGRDIRGRVVYWLSPRVRDGL